MKIKRNFLLLLAMIVMVTMLASCCVYERPSLIATPPTTKFSQDPPISTIITELQFKGGEETLTVQFDPEKGVCTNVTTTKGEDVSCDDVRIEFNQLFICTLKSKAKWHGHEVNTVIGKTSVRDLLVEGEGVYCAPIKYLSEGAIFKFKPERGGKNIRCGSSGGAAYCPR